MDSHTVSRMGLRLLLEAEPDLQVIGEVTEFHEADAAVARLSPQVVVADAHAEADAAAALQAFRRLARHPRGSGVRLVALVHELDESVPLWQAAGAHGVITGQSSPGQIVAAVRMVAAGYRLLTPEPSPAAGTSSPGSTPAAGQAAAPAPLATGAPFEEELALNGVTPRERDMLQFIARGFSNAEISEALFLSESTVKSHVQHMLDKLDLRNRVHAVIYAYEKGMVRAGDDLDALVGAPT
ncbi:response regulator transcription factor [Streptacidiphilus sp. EB129]|uniref:response regulator transcription factor n=1 Tax=Streptacidiphilus sp. EB129 TaxID=3156262 RepID=UPI00351664CF